MKKLFIFLTLSLSLSLFSSAVAMAFPLTSGAGKSLSHSFSLSPLDTIDYWHVYLNDFLIAKFDDNSKNAAINLVKRKLKSTDVITVRYGDDTPCVDCSYGLIAYGEMKRKLPVAVTTEHFGKLSISVKELLDIQRTDGVDQFFFRYYEGTDKYYAGTENGPKRAERLLFVLTIS